MPACTYFTTLFELLCSVIGPFSWSSSMKKSGIGQLVINYNKSTMINYLYDCLAPPDYQLAPINRDSSQDNHKVVPDVDRLDEPAKLIGNVSL